MSWREDIERWSATGTLVAYIDDLARAVVDQEDEFATAQSHLTHALDDAATQRARADAAEAECARLTACLKRGNAAMEQMERELYLRIVDIERERDVMEQQRDAARAEAAGLRAALDAATREAALAETERDTLRGLTDAMRADNVRLRAIVESVRSARAVSAAAATRYTAAWDAVGTMPPTLAQSEEIAAALRAAYEAGDALTAALDAAGEGR